MGQVTIYLEKEIEEKIANDWPESITGLAGAWQDFPSLDEIRAGTGEDGMRVDL